jgi:hypothetical protein
MQLGRPQQRNSQVRGLDAVLRRSGDLGTDVAEDVLLVDQFVSLKRDAECGELIHRDRYVIDRPDTPHV